MIPDLDYFTFRHPRRSSDYALRADLPGTPCGFFMAVDMVGHPERLRWQNYTHVMEQQMRRSLAASRPSSAEGLFKHITDAILWHNDAICKLRHGHDKDAFGFCVSAAAIWERQVRVWNLGDCRAYHLSYDTGGRASSRCLTRDRHLLHDVLTNQAPSYISPDRLSEYSHVLGSYMGMSNRAQVEEALAQPVDVELSPGDCLWLSTDGFHMPVVRSNAGHSLMQLTADEYYLERWMAAQMTRAREYLPPWERNFWPEVGEWLLVESLRAAQSHTNCRDDIAVLGVYLPFPDDRRPPVEKPLH